MTGKNITFMCIITIILIIVSIYWYISHDIKEQLLQDDPMLFKLKEMLSPLHPDIKNIKLYKGEKSYTINKDKIYLCLRDENGIYYPINMLVYVLAHEISHFLNKDDIGHTPKFDQIFDDLLAKATALGIYDPSIAPIRNYCSH